MEGGRSGKGPSAGKQVTSLARPQRLGTKDDGVNARSPQDDRCDSGPLPPAFQRRAGGGCLVTPVTPLSPSPRCLSLSLSLPLPQATSLWPLPVSPRTLLFLITWPFITQWLLRRWQGRKR